MLKYDSTAKASGGIPGGDLLSGARVRACGGQKRHVVRKVNAQRAGEGQVWETAQSKRGQREIDQIHIENARPLAGFHCRDAPKCLPESPRLDCLRSGCRLNLHTGRPPLYFAAYNPVLG